jgi:MFS family permease
MTLQSALRRYYTVFFLKNFASSIPAGVLVLYILQKGLSVQDIGIIFGVISLTVIFLEIPTGGLADTLGRKNIALAGFLFNFAAVCILLAANNLPTAVFYSLLLGIGLSLGSGSLEAWFIDKIEEENPDVDLQPYLARQDFYETVANALGALLGGLLPYLTMTYGWPTFQPLSSPLILSLVFRILSILTLILLIPSDTPNREIQYKPYAKLQNILKTSFSLVLQKTQLKYLLLITFVNGIALGSFDAFWQPYIKLVMNLTEENTVSFGLLQAAGFVCATIGSLYASTFVKQIRYHNLAALSAQIGKTLIFLCLASSVNFYAIGIAFGLFYITLMLNISPHMTLYNQQVSSENRSTLLSISSLVLFLGAGLGAVIFGYLAENYSFSIAFLVLALPTFLSSFFYIGIESRAKVTQI